MLRSDTVAAMVIPESVPRYELRVRVHGPVDTVYEVWQLPSPATPHVRVPARCCRTSGPKSGTHRASRIAPLGARRSPPWTWPVCEPQEARVRLAPKSWLSRSACSSASSPQCAVATTCGLWPKALRRWSAREAAYWLGMAMHRRHPRRVLTAIRVLLTDQPPRGVR